MGTQRNSEMTPKSPVGFLLSNVDVIKLKKFIVIKLLNQSICSSLKGNQTMLHLNHFIGFWNSFVAFENNNVIA